MSRQHPNLPKQRSPCDLPSQKSTHSFWHTQPSPLLTAHRSTRNLPSKADVVIVGSGVTGASIAHHLFEDAPDNHNLDVVMLEAREACWGATGRNGGHCQPILFETPHDPTIGDFELLNFHTLQTLITTRAIACEFVAQPGVRAIYSRHHLDEAELALHIMSDTAPHLRQKMRLVTDQAELEGYRIPTAKGAVVTEVAARMWPYKFVARILEDLLTSSELKGSFNLQTLTPVLSLQPSASSSGNKWEGEGGWMVETPRGKIEAKRVVLATNAYTSHLLPEFADLIVPCRGQMSALEPLPSVEGDNRLKSSLGFLGDGLDDYLIQRPNEKGGHLMFGGGRQHGPSLGVTDDSVLDEQTAKYLRSRLVQALGLPERGVVERKRCEKCVGQMLPCPPKTAGNLTPCQQSWREKTADKDKKAPTEFRALNEWSGIMGFSRDERPWVGPVPKKPGVYLSAGYTGHGMPNTWLCGKSAALMVRESFFRQEGRREDDGDEFEVATKATGLPTSYHLTEERMRRALEVEDVEAKEWAEMERGRWEDRPHSHSGYA